MRWCSVALVLSVVVSAPAAAGEVHIISRDNGGDFLASHQIFVNQRRGMARVDYCGRTYFAYWGTLDWLDMQAYEGHELGVEYSNGENWRLICRNPQQQVAEAPEAANSSEHKTRAVPTGHNYSWIGLLNKRPSN